MEYKQQQIVINKCKILNMHNTFQSHFQAICNTCIVLKVTVSNTKRVYEYINGHTYRVKNNKNQEKGMF